MLPSRSSRKPVTMVLSSTSYLKRDITCISIIRRIRINWWGRRSRRSRLLDDMDQRDDTHTCVITGPLCIGPWSSLFVIRQPLRFRALEHLSWDLQSPRTSHVDDATGMEKFPAERNQSPMTEGIGGSYFSTSFRLSPACSISSHRLFCTGEAIYLLTLPCIIEHKLRSGDQVSACFSDPSL